MEKQKQKRGQANNAQIGPKIQKQIVEKIEEEQKIVEGNKRMVEIYEGKIREVINKI